jgi:hypothetical protein
MTVLPFAVDWLDELDSCVRDPLYQGGLSKLSKYPRSSGVPRGFLGINPPLGLCQGFLGLGRVTCRAAAGIQLPLAAHHAQYATKTHLISECHLLGKTDLLAPHSENHGHWTRGV